MSGRGRQKGAAVSEFERALRRSLRAAVEGDGARAQSWLERAVELDSSDFDAYQALARLYRDRREVGRAIRMHQNLLLRDDLTREEQGQAKLELARDFAAGGFRDRAHATFEELLEERGQDPDVLEAYAQTLLEGGDAIRARRLCARLARLDAERAAALEARFPDAGTRAASRARGGLVSRFVTGFGSRRREEARERALSERLDRDPHDVAARLELARANVGRADSARARAILERGLDLMPEALVLHVEQGRLWLASGQDGEALKAYARLLDVLEAQATSCESGTGGGSQGAAGRAVEGGE